MAHPFRGVLRASGLALDRLAVVGNGEWSLWDTEVALRQILRHSCDKFSVDHVQDMIYGCAGLDTEHFKYELCLWKGGLSRIRKRYPQMLALTGNSANGGF